MKFKLLILFAVIPVLFYSCKKKDSNPIQPVSSIYSGTWDFTTKGDLVGTSVRTIDSDGKFDWSLSISYRPYSENRAIVRNEYFQIKGNVSTNGNLLAIIVRNDTTRGDFSGNLGNQNGSGVYTLSADLEYFRCTWTAIKR